MVVAMAVSDANSKVSLNHNDQDATPHGGASCCDSVIGDLHWYPDVSPSPVTFCSVSVQQNRGERIIDAVLRLRLQGASRRRAIVPSRQRALSENTSTSRYLAPGGGYFGNVSAPIESTTSLFNENARACAGLLIAKIQFNGIGGSQTYISLTPNSVVSSLRFLWRGGL
jgi:hypothetical protein